MLRYLLLSSFISCLIINSAYSECPEPPPEGQSIDGVKTAADREGIAFMRSVFAGDLKAVDTALKTKPHLARSLYLGCDALTIAAGKGDIPVLKRVISTFLLNKWDLNLGSRRPLQEAIVANQFESAKTLLSLPRVVPEPKALTTLAVRALYFGNTQIFEFALKKGLPMNHLLEKGGTFLHLALSIKDPVLRLKVTQFLLEENKKRTYDRFDINHSIHGKVGTALTYVSKYDDATSLESVKLLMQNGAQPLINKDGWGVSTLADDIRHKTFVWPNIQFILEHGSLPKGEDLAVTLEFLISFHPEYTTEEDKNNYRKMVALILDENKRRTGTPNFLDLNEITGSQDYGAKDHPYKHYSLNRFLTTASDISILTDFYPGLFDEPITPEHLKVIKEVGTEYIEKNKRFSFEKLLALWRHPENLGFYQKAVEKSRREIVQALLKAGVKPPSELLALSHTIPKDIYELLNQSQTIDLTHTNQEKLQTAITTYDLDLLDSLIAQDPGILERTLPGGEHVLEYAIQHASEKSVLNLVNNTNANFNFKDKNGTPLALAAFEKGYSELGAALLDQDDSALKETLHAALTKGPESARTVLSQVTLTLKESLPDLERKEIHQQLKHLRDTLESLLPESHDMLVAWGDFVFKLYVDNKSSVYGREALKIYSDLSNAPNSSNVEESVYLETQILRCLALKGELFIQKNPTLTDEHLKRLNSLVSQYQASSHSNEGLSIIQNYLKTNHPELGDFDLESLKQGDSKRVFSEFLGKFVQCQQEKRDLALARDAADRALAQCQREKKILQDQIEQLLRQHGLQASCVPPIEPQTAAISQMIEPTKEVLTRASRQSSQTYDSPDDSDAEDDSTEKTKKVEPPYKDNPWKITLNRNAIKELKTLDGPDKENYSKIVKALAIGGPKLRGYPDKKINFGKLVGRTKAEYHVHLGNNHKKTIHWVFSKKDHEISIIHLGDHQ